MSPLKHFIVDLIHLNLIEIDFQLLFFDIYRGDYVFIDCFWRYRKVSPNTSSRPSPRINRTTWYLPFWGFFNGWCGAFSCRVNRRVLFAIAKPSSGVRPFNLLYIDSVCYAFVRTTVIVCAILPHLLFEYI